MDKFLALYWSEKVVFIVNVAFTRKASFYSILLLLPRSLFFFFFSLFHFLSDTTTTFIHFVDIRSHFLFPPFRSSFSTSSRFFFHLFGFLEEIFFSVSSEESTYTHRLHTHDYDYRLNLPNSLIASLSTPQTCTSRLRWQKVTNSTLVSRQLQHSGKMAKCSFFFLRFSISVGMSWISWSWRSPLWPTFEDDVSSRHVTYMLRHF